MSQWDGKTRGGTFGYAFFIFLIKHFGVWSAYLFLFVVVPYFIPFAPASTKASWIYWRKIHKKGVFSSIVMLFRHYYRFGQVIVDKIAINSGLADRYKFTFTGMDDMISSLKNGEGCIMIGAHFGNWEVSREFMKEYDGRINVVMMDAEYVKIKDKLEAVMGARPFKVIPVSTDSIDHIYSIKQALENGEFVCFQGDRYMDGDKTVDALFLGQNASFPVGPFEVASLMKSKIYYFLVERTGKSYNFDCRPFVKKEGMSRKQEIQESFSSYIEFLTDRVCKYPEQWFNFYDFWRLSSKS